MAVAVAGYPPTRVVDVVHTYGVVRLPDPFVWLEDNRDPEVEAWFRAQDAHARSFIAGLPGRAALIERIREIDEAKAVQIHTFERVGGRYFYLRQAIGEEVASLYFRDGLDGEERLVVDPARFARSGGVYSIHGSSPAPDGALTAVAIEAGGSEIPDLYLVEVNTGEATGTVIPRVRAGAYWLPDGSGFFYTQMRPIDPAEPRVQRYQRMPVKFHRLGSDPADDPVIVAYGQTPEAGLGPVDSALVVPLTESELAILYVSHGVDRAVTLHVAQQDALLGPSIPWRQISSRTDLIETLTIIDDRAYLLSAKDAPRKRILRVDLAGGTVATAEELVPESDLVITSLTSVGGRLFYSAMDGGVDRLFTADPREVPFRVEEIPLPLIGRVTFLSNDPREPELFISLTAWNQAPSYYRWEPQGRVVEEIGLRPIGPFDRPEGLRTERHLVRSHDGVMVPLTILYKEGIELNGRNPTLLYGYGAYGMAQRPAFGPMRLAWYEQGGIFAVAHVRGGGEFGKAWHTGGHLDSKRNSWLDFNAAAEFLIEKGYAGKGTVGAMGGSMGGVLVGRAMTSRPDLYGAVVSRVGNHNPVRNHIRANGPANYPEYGNPLDPELFPYVLAMDSYYAVRDGVRYPPMLLTSGYNDSRVDSWMPGKMAARLQQADPEGGPHLMRVEFQAGHGGVARSDIYAEEADVYAFLLWALRPQD